MVEKKDENPDAVVLGRFIKCGDQESFELLVRRYERLVWSVSLRMLRNRCDAEDAFQSTFLLLSEKAARIRKPESLSNWLYSTAWKVASRIRKRRILSSLDTRLSQGFDIAQEEDSQLSTVARQHEIDLVDQHLHALHERHRTPLILYYFAGLTAKQIAHQLNLTVAATEGRLRRARARLREELRGAGVHSSPLLLSVAMNRVVLNNSQFAINTTERCATAGSFVGKTNLTLTSGVKLMICKGICAAGITLILSVGSLLHTSAPIENSQTIELASVTAQDTVPSIQAGTIESCSSRICPLGVCMEACGGVCEAFHAHVGDVHAQLAASVDSWLN